MKHSITRNMPAIILAVGMSLAPFAVRAQSAPADEAPFLAENAVAMDRMMADMAVKPTGDGSILLMSTVTFRNEPF